MIIFVPKVILRQYLRKIVDIRSRLKDLWIDLGIMLNGIWPTPLDEMTLSELIDWHRLISKRMKL